MENISLIFFISIIVPLCVACLIFDKRTRTNIFFLMLGILTCFFCGEFDGFLFQFFDIPEKEFAINVTPIVEEIAKAYPLLIYAFVFSPGRQKLMESAVIVGVGFAIFENVYILSQNIRSVSVGLALIRGFGSGMMHGVSTLAVGYGISFIVMRRKLFITGSLGMLCVAVAYHSIYNELVQSPLRIVGFILPILTFIPFCVFLKRKAKQNRLRSSEAKNQ